MSNFSNFPISGGVVLGTTLNCPPTQGVVRPVPRGAWHRGAVPRTGPLGYRAPSQSIRPSPGTRGSARVVHISSASRGTIEKKSERSSERAETGDSRGPLREATRDSELTERELGARGPRTEGTPGLVDDKGTVAEGDSSKLATGGTSAAVPGTEETDTSKNSRKTEQKKRKVEEDNSKSETNNEDAKKLKISTDEGEAHAQQKCKTEDLESGDISVAGGCVTEVDENGTDVSDQKVEVTEETLGTMRYGVVLEGYPDVKMTEEQAEVVGTLLVERINQSHEGEPIQFSEAEYENGGLAFTCVNKATRAWLCSTVPQIVPWPGARLEIGRADTMLNGCRFILRVHDVTGMNKRSNRHMLDLFQKQNKHISSAKWKVIRGVAETDKRKRLTLWVDEKSSEDLKERNYRLFLGLARVKFMPMLEWKTSNVMVKRHNL